MNQKINILLTGGAGFIGSNLAERLLSLEQVASVRILDNLLTGKFENIQTFSGHPKLDFVLGDIRDYQTCLTACKGMDVICHQAALGSVPRSLNDPITTNAINVVGTLNLFTAAKKAGIKKIVHACSSSTYGDSKKLPKVEDKIGKPLSPYAVTKLVSELYADVFSANYDMQFIGLRYFNVFGPKQNPNGAYAAVIPLFINQLIDGQSPKINGDGLHSRDFTYIDNVVQANIKSIFCENPKAWNQVYNIAFGERTSLISLFKYLKMFTKSELSPIFGPTRLGDIKHSLADISKAKKLLGYAPKVSVEEGLKRTVKWYHTQLVEKV